MKGGQEPQTDFTPPELISYTINEEEISAGKRFHIEYEVSEVVSELNEIRFIFQNETGNSIYVEDRDNDGVATRTIEGSQLNGEYKLHRIELRTRLITKIVLSIVKTALTKSY